MEDKKKLGGLVILPEQRIACSFQKWYDLFRIEGKHTILSVNIPLEKKFLEFLKKDGVRLPMPPNNNVESLNFRDPRRIKPVMKDEEDNEWDCSSSDEEVESFHQLECKIQKGIDELGGEVFPKLNWTSPKDAVWMMTQGNLQCASPGEIYLLLKSSDLIHHDLRIIEQTQVEPVLVLRKWVNLNHSLEFRCFVRDGKLMYACQRDASHFFPFLIVKEMKEKILNLIKNFVNGILIPRLLNGGSFPFERCIADVYIEFTSRKPEGKCWLIDLAPLPTFQSLITTEEEKKMNEEIIAIPPHPLLMSWEEVLEGEIIEEQLLVVLDTNSVDSSERKVMSMNRVPLDIVHGHLNSKTMEEVIKNLESLKKGDSIEE